MNSNKVVLISVANAEVGAAIATNLDLPPSALAFFFLARNDITVGALRHASVQSHIQVPWLEKGVHIFIFFRNA